MPERHLSCLKLFLWVLALFDLATALPLLIAPTWVLSLAGLNDPAVSWAMYRPGTIEPMFVRGVGLLWLMTFYLQATAARSPAERPELISTSLFFRFLGMCLDLFEVFLLLPAAGVDSPVLNVVLVVFAGLDLPCIVTTVVLTRKAGIELPAA